jgi:hypothetical protein
LSLPDRTGSPTRARPTGTPRSLAVFACACTLSFASCARNSVSVIADTGVVCIEGIPHVEQRPDFCGEACAEMYLRKLGHEIDQDDVFNVSNTDPLLGRGCYAPELVTALKRLGFSTGAVWYKVRPGSDDEVRAQWAAVLADLEEDIPSIVCMRANTKRNAPEHFRLIVGYDGGTDEVIYHEPASDDGAYRRMSLHDLLECWPLKSGGGGRAIIRIRLDAGEIKVPKRKKGYSNADFVRHVMELKTRIPSDDFTVVIQDPFVVIGDESPAMVERRALSTVAWATERLKKLYFDKDPDEIIDIWLFKDDAGYRKHAREIFGDEPDTPYGYSSAEHSALIMNIRTGGGTLVHEIVHPFVDANFPECPAWFNEGLGSLYEQSGSDGDGGIIGLTNWRLAGLQAAIRRGRIPSFKTLLSTTTYEFYEEDPGTNYGQARYLCYYLQEKGLLVKFYKEFHANHEKDPTGYKTLKKVLGEDDMDEFKKEWEEYVLGLRFDGR